MFQTLQQDFDVRPSAVERSLCPFWPCCERECLAFGVAALTSVERALPSLEILGDLGHLHIGIELLDLVQDGVFIVISKVIK